MLYLLKQIKKISAVFYQKIDPIRFARRAGMTVGENCIIESFNFGSEPYLITIGDHVEITTEVTFLTHDGATWVMRDEPGYENVIRFGRINIKDNVFIGHGCIILPNVEIGENVVIGAGSVVTKDIPPNSVAVGNPARVISTCEEYKKKCLRETPDWNKEAYRKNKKAEVLRVVEKRRKKERYEKNNISS